MDYIYNMIIYYNNLTNEVEKKRNMLFYLTLGILLIGIILFSFNINLKLTIVSIYMFVFSIIFSIVFLKQSNYNYPIKKFNQWKWFYYGNPYIPLMTTNIFNNCNKDKCIENYTKGLEYFISQYNLKETIKEKEDLNQLYLLQVHNYFKNRFYKQLIFLQKIFIYGFIVIFIILFFI